MIKAIKNMIRCLMNNGLSPNQHDVQEPLLDQGQSEEQAQALCQKQKCGHCVSLEEDDHCGIPEHRYCAFCQIISNNDTDDEYSHKLYTTIQTVLKDDRLPPDLKTLLNTVVNG